MRKRPRPACSFKPKTDELEKLSPVSSLVVGQLPAAAHVAVDQPASAAPSPAPADTVATRSGGVSSRPSALAMSLPDAGIVTASSQPPALQRDSPVSAPKPAPAGTIRPLSLAPGERQVAPPPQASSPAAVSGIVGAASSIPHATGGIPAATGGTATVGAVATPAPGGVDDPAPAPTVAVGQLGGNAGAVGQETEHGAHRSGGGASARVGHAPTGRTGGLPLSHGLVATGGSHRGAAPSYANSYGMPGGTGGGGGAGTGTGTGTGLTGIPSGTGTGTGTVAGTNTDAVSASGSSLGGSHFTSGTFSIAGTGSMPMPDRGPVKIQSSGYNLIGSPESLTVMASGGGGATISNVKWSISGTPVMYSGQTVPNPSLGQNAFVNAPYDISTQNGSSVGFYWGEKPGTANVTAVVTVKDKNGSQDVMVKAEIPVADPGWKGAVVDQKSLAVVNDPGGAVLSYSSPPKPGVAGKDGISWGTLQPSKGSGSFRIVQTIAGGTTTIKRDKPPAVVTGFWNVDKSANPPKYTAARFPLLDVPRDAGVPFYPGTADSPETPLSLTYNTFAIDESFNDSVMYKPDAGIWVPEGTFAWAINGTATTKAAPARGWTVATTAAGLTSQLAVDHTAWPSGWTDVAGKYMSLRRIS